jgi:NhaC family Na+:H+ antiporter
LSINSSSDDKKTSTTKEPTLVHAFFPIVILIIFLALNVSIWGDDTLSGSNQIALMFGAAVAGIVAMTLGIKWDDIIKSVVKSISSAMPAILILFLIGALAGTWLLSGVIPTMVYYGLQILNPSIFLGACVVITALVSLATGSSWSTVATIGIALLGIGNALGIGEGMTAGAIISGAYFGDKMSPLSDTTNLAPAMAGTDLFTHIRYMTITTGPSITIALILFLIIGFTMDTQATQTNIQDVLQAIEKSFYISPVLFLVPILLLIIIIKKTPALPALLIGSLLGALFAILLQPTVIREISQNDGSYAMASYIAVVKSMYGKIQIVSENAQINELLSTGGMTGMLNTIWLILAAMVFGGIMESAGLLVRISKAIIKLVKSTGSLVASTVGTCLFFNFTASDQYISIVVPGRMYSKLYRERGYKPELLSRTLEDSGTVTSVLIPWNTCGATQSSVLGVPVLTYVPYAFFNLLSPIMSILIAYLNIKIRRLSNDNINEPTDSEEKI